MLVKVDNIRTKIYFHYRVALSMFIDGLFNKHNDMGLKVRLM